jgi:hypothetical protein
MMPCRECGGTKRHEKDCPEKWAKSRYPPKPLRPYGLNELFLKWILGTHV